MANKNISILVTAVDRMSAPFKKMGATMWDMSKKVADFWKKHKETFESMRNYGALASASVIWLWLSFIGTSKKFQQYEVALSNAMGSQEDARKSMAMINDVASKTPFQLEELTQSYITLVNRWFKPTKQEIISLGDIAASQGKSFDQLAEALLDATTGEFERLKEFGIRASAHGDKVSFTFKWVTTTVAKTDKAIQDYIVWLWKLEWVSWWMEQQSKTLEGRLSTLKDTFDLTGKSIGDSLLPILIPLIERMTVVLEKVGSWVAQNPELAATILAVVWWLSVLATIVGTLWLALPILNAWLFTMATATGAVTVTVWAILWPLSLLILALWLLWYNYKLISKERDLMAATFKLQASVIFDSLTKKFWDLKAWFLWRWDWVKWLFTDWRWSLRSVAETLVDWIVDSITWRFTRMFDFAKSTFDKMKAFVWIWDSSTWWQNASFWWNRAWWGKVYAGKEYIVWENWPEKIIPMANWYVVPNKESSAVNMSLSFGNISVHNEADENRLVNKIKSAIYREMELYRRGIA